MASVADAIDCLERAESSKRRAATAMNERSSRAHSLVIATVEQVCNLCPTISHSRSPGNLPHHPTSCDLMLVRHALGQCVPNSAHPGARDGVAAASSVAHCRDSSDSSDGGVDVGDGEAVVGIGGRTQPPTKLGPTAA